MNQTTFLGRMREVLEGKLTGTFYLYSPAYASDSAGGYTVTYAEGSRVETLGHLETPKPGRELPIAGKHAESQVFVLHLPEGTTVAPDYRVSDGTVVYEVIAVDAPTTLEAMRAVWVARLQ